MRIWCQSLLIFASSVIFFNPAPAHAQAISPLPRPVLLEKARLGFDHYMLGEFEAASLAKIQKSAFPANWTRLRNEFANTTADRMQGKINREEAQRRFGLMIRDSFADVEQTIARDMDVLGRAPRSELIAWETAFGQHLSRHLEVNPSGCSVATAMRRPASPAETMAKLDLVAAFWTAYGRGKTAPVDRRFDVLTEGDAAEIDRALTATRASTKDREAIVAQGRIADIATLSCDARLALSKALLVVDARSQERMMAHVITRLVS